MSFMLLLVDDNSEWIRHFIIEDERSRQRPEDKFKLPQTSSDEIGWFSSTPVAISRSEYKEQRDIEIDST